MTLLTDVRDVLTANGFTVKNPAADTTNAFPFLTLKYAGFDIGDEDPTYVHHRVDVCLYAGVETEGNAQEVLAEEMERMVALLIAHLRGAFVEDATEAQYGIDQGERPSTKSPVYSVVRITK